MNEIRVALDPDPMVIITHHYLGGLRFFERLTDPEWMTEGRRLSKNSSGPNSFQRVEIHGDFAPSSLTELCSTIANTKELSFYGCSAEFISEILPRCPAVEILHLTCCTLPNWLIQRLTYSIVSFHESVSAAGPFRGFTAPTVTVRLPCDFDCYRELVHRCSLCFIDGGGLDDDIESSAFSNRREKMFGFHAKRVSISFRNLIQLISIDASNISISGLVHERDDQNAEPTKTTCSNLDLRHLEFEGALDLDFLLRGQLSVEALVLPTSYVEPSLFDLVASMPNLTELWLDNWSSKGVCNCRPNPTVTRVLLPASRRRRLRDLHSVFPNTELVVL